MLLLILNITVIDEQSFALDIRSLETFKVELGRFLEQLLDTPPVTGYLTICGNTLLSWN